MDKSSILVTGLGQCGGKLADTMKEFNGRYTTNYINSSLGDIKGLKHADLDNNVLIYSGTDGSGRIREKGKKFFETDAIRVADFIGKFRQFKHSVVCTSLDGGTGSGTLIHYIKLLKRLMPTMTITVIGVLPKLSSESLNLDNAKKCLKEYEKYIKDLVNGLILINNEKCNISYEQINLEAISIIDAFFGMVGHHEDGSIDNGNLNNVITAGGYISLFKLPNVQDVSVRDAMKQAKEKNIFALPESFRCLFGAVNVVEGMYNKDSICEKIKAKKTTYSTYNKKGLNLVALSGCSMPNDDIDDLLDELQVRQENDDDYEIEGFNILDDEEDTVYKKPEKQEKTNVFMEEEDIDYILKDADFFKF